MKLRWIGVLSVLFSSLASNSLAFRDQSQSKKYVPETELSAQQYFPRKGAIMPSLANETVASGRGITFRCRVVRKGLSYRIRWKRNGANIEQNNRVRITDQYWGSRLRIRDARPDDAGMYQCVVKTRNGQRFKSIAWLNVKGKRPRCEVYRGSICNEYVSSNVFLPSSKQQYEIEKEIEKMASYQDKLKGRCRKNLVPFLCRYFFPPCDLKYVCRDQCENMEKKACRKSLRSFRSFHQAWRKLIHCDDLQSNARGQKSGCLKIGSNLTTPKPPKSGACRPYTGSLCLDHMAPGSRVLSSNSLSERKAEEEMRKTLQLFTDYTSLGCAKVVRKALCHHVFPACTNNSLSRAQQMCRDDCDMLYSTSCSKEFALVEKLKKSHPYIQRILPNCSSLPFNGEKNCLKLGLIANDTADHQGRATCPSYLQNQRAAVKIIPTRIKTWDGHYQVCGGKTVNTNEIPNTEASRLIRNITDNFAKGELLFYPNETNTRYCLKLRFHFADLVKNWANSNQSLDLPNLEGVLDIGEVPGLEITLAKSSQLQSVTIPLGSAVSYQVHERIRLENVTFFYRYQSGRGSMIVRGLYDLCETPFSLTVERLSDGTLKVSGDSEAPFDLETVEKAFYKPKTPLHFSNVVKQSKIWVVRLVKPRMEAYIGKYFSVKFSGDSYLGDKATPIHLEFQCTKRSGGAFTVGVTSDHMSLRKALKTFLWFEVKLPSLGLFDQDSNDSRVGVSLSSASVNVTQNPHLQFLQKPLSTAFVGSIPEGLSFSLRNMTPESCADRQLCQLLQLVFGAGSKFTTSASSTADGDVFLSAKFDDHTTAPFQRMELTMKVHPAPQFLGFVVEHNVTVDGKIFSSGQHPKAWPFTGRLRYVGWKSTLEGSFETKVSWNKAFGVEHLSIRNTNIRIFLGSTAPSHENRVSGKVDFEYGVGCAANVSSDVNRENCITGDATFGFSDNPAQHYFHVTVHPVNLNKLISASGFDLKLPGALATTGFPRGLQVSIAKQDHDLQAAGGPFLPAGFTFKGKMKILGILTDVSIFLKSTEFLIDASVRADDSKMEEAADLSRDEPKNSPKFLLRARVNPALFTQTAIDGFARLRGVFDELRMSMRRDAMQLRLVTNINKSLQVSLHLVTNYSNSLNKTHFRTKITFHNGLTKLTRLVSKHVIDMIEVEMSRMKSAELEVRRRRKKCQSSAKQECDKCVGDVKCEASLSNCHAQISLKEKPAKGGITTNALCQTMVLERCQEASDMCNITCHVISSRANKTCYPLVAAVEAQKDLERRLKWVHDADKNVNTNLFKIHGITFEATLATDSIEQVTVETTMEVTVFGKKHSLTGLKLSFQEFAKLASEIAKHAVDWYQKSQPDSKTRHPDNRPRPSAS